MGAYKHKLGAGLYVAWALLHLPAAHSTYELGFGMPEGLERAHVLQDAFNLAWIALLVLVVAVWLVWRNHRSGYWIALLVAGLADVGFVLHLVLPGAVPLEHAVLGPLLWILAAALTTSARR